MSWMRTIAILVALAGLGSSGAVLAADKGQTHVRLNAGEIAGTTEGRTLVFRGIPYAAAPVGDLRWRPPVAAEKWSGVRDATSYGAACPQGPEHKEPWAQVGPQSEDCLFLNVWRPKRPGTYPVMVFLHGGGFTYGAAGVPLYDGTSLAERGAVIVTMNYRLGRLGFFAHPALTKENPDGQLGNYGIMDQVAALRWVRDNIAKFGGNPANITLLGESAGAGTVQLLMASPTSAGLFQKAISESGAGGNVLPAIRGGAVNAEAVGDLWAKSLGLTDATPAQLRAIPVAEIIKGRGFPFIDGKVVTMSPGDAFRLKKEMRIPLIIGSNSNEGSLIGNNSAIAKPLLGDAYPDLLAAYLKRPGSTPTSAALDLAEDAASVLPSLSIAVMHAQNGATAYGFKFDHVRVDERAGTLGAQHGGEIEFLFGNKPVGQSWDADDAKVSKLMGDYWVRFAKTGNPNEGGAPKWLPVTGQPTDYLVIGTPTAATKLTSAEERVRALALQIATKGWIAQDHAK